MFSRMFTKFSCTVLLFLLTFMKLAFFGRVIRNRPRYWDPHLFVTVEENVVHGLHQANRTGET